MLRTSVFLPEVGRAQTSSRFNRARALTARRADRRVDARLTTKSISQHPADIRNEFVHEYSVHVSELLLDHAARALCYTWRSGPFFEPVTYRVTSGSLSIPLPFRRLALGHARKIGGGACVQADRTTRRLVVSSVPHLMNSRARDRQPSSGKCASASSCP